jgi:hypothetical protein
MVTHRSSRTRPRPKPADSTKETPAQRDGAEEHASVRDRYWPIIFAAMKRATEVQETDAAEAVFLAEAVARLITARKAYVAARFEYQCIRLHVDRRVARRVAKGGARV